MKEVRWLREEPKSCAFFYYYYMICFVYSSTRYKYYV